MFCAGLLFLLFNIATASLRQCPGVGTYEKPGKVLDPLAKQMLDKMPSKPSYDCDMESAVLIKMTIDDDDETMKAVHPEVEYKKYLEFETTKQGETSNTEASDLVEEALKQWSGDLQGMQASKFGCNIDRNEDPTTTTFKIGCIFN